MDLADTSSVAMTESLATRRVFMVDRQICVRRLQDAAC